MDNNRVAYEALITSPDILLLDEPFSALDNHLRATMERELVGTEEEKGATIFGYYVRDPREYGVVEFDENGKALISSEY